MFARGQDREIELDEELAKDSLMTAVSGRNEDDVTLALRQLNAVQINSIRNEDNEPILTMGIASGKLGIVQKLVEKKADINPANVSRTPWTAAAQQTNLKILELLHRVDPSFGITSTPGNTPLHEAALSGHLWVVKYLLNPLGIDPALTNQYGQTADAVATTDGIRQMIMAAKRARQFPTPIGISQPTLPPASVMASAAAHWSSPHGEAKEKKLEVKLRASERSEPNVVEEVGGKEL